MAKTVLQAQTPEQIYDFVSTYSYWAILDGTDLLFSTENNKDADFQEKLTESIDIAAKRGRQYLHIRVGSNERNSRSNNEMVADLAIFNPNIQTFPTQMQANAPTPLNGFPNNRPLNNTGITATEMQTYLNGALERQKQEMQLLNQSTLAGMQAEMAKQKAESEIALMKQMAQQEIQFERRMIAYEKDKLEQKIAEFEAMQEDFEDEKQRSNEGIKGFGKTLAGWYNDLVDDDYKPKKKDNDLNGKNEDKTETKEPESEEETIDFEFVDDQEQEEPANNEIDILNGIDKMDKDELAVIQELVAEKLQASDNTEETSTENENNSNNNNTNKQNNE